MIAMAMHFITYLLLLYAGMYHLCMLLFVGDIIIYLIIKHNSEHRDLFNIIMDIKIKLYSPKTLILATTMLVFCAVIGVRKTSWSAEQSASFYLIGLATYTILAMAFMYYKFIIERKK